MLADWFCWRIIISKLFMNIKSYRLFVCNNLYANRKLLFAMHILCMLYVRNSIPVSHVNITKHNKQLWSNKCLVTYTSICKYVYIYIHIFQIYLTPKKPLYPTNPQYPQYPHDPQNPQNQYSYKFIYILYSIYVYMYDIYYALKILNPIYTYIYIYIYSNIISHKTTVT